MLARLKDLGAIPVHENESNWCMRLPNFFTSDAHDAYHELSARLGIPLQYYTTCAGGFQALHPKRDEPLVIWVVRDSGEFLFGNTKSEFVTLKAGDVAVFQNTYMFEDSKTIKFIVFTLCK